MKFQRPDLYFLLFLALLVILVVSGAWVNTQYTTQNPGGEGFVAAWAGTNVWVNRDNSPYSDEATQTAQEMFYGGQAPSWKDQFLFTYPFYSVLVFGLFSGVEDFSLARAYWMTALEISLISIGVISLMMTRWKPSRLLGIMFFGFVLLNYHSLTGLVQGNPALLSAVLISLSLLFVQTGRDVFAGVALALATIKPEMVLLLALFILLWAYSHRKMGIISGFFGTLLVLVWWSNINYPGWFTEYVIRVFQSHEYAGPVWLWNLFEIWWGDAGRTAGLALFTSLGIVLLREWALAWKKEERWFLWTAGLTLVSSNFLMWYPNSVNFSAMLPVMVMVFSVWQQRWGTRSNLMVGIVLGVLGLGLWGVNNWLGHPLMIEPISLFLTFPSFLLASLFWVRYWALGSRRLPIQKLEVMRNI